MIKYDKLPDNFHDLETTLQTEFVLLKKATSKNIEQFQDAINVMYLSDIKSCVARTSIGAQFLSVGAQFLSVGAQFLSVGAQDAPACYGLCEK